MEKHKKMLLRNITMIVTIQFVFELNLSCYYNKSKFEWKYTYIKILTMQCDKNL